MVVLAVVAVLAGSPAAPPQPPATIAVGQPLAGAIRTLEGRGLRVVYDPELITADMVVLAAPRSRTPRQQLDELLRPHALEVREVVGGILVVVRAAVRASQPAPPPPPVGRVRGRVVDAESGLALPGAIVTVAKREGVTGGDGRFDLDGVPAGRVQLLVSLVGFGLARRLVDVAAGATADVLVPLAPGAGAYTETVTVRAAEPVGGGAEARRLGSAELQDLKGTLVDDPLRAVQSLPGVATGDDFRGEFSVRGSDFRHVGLSIDGIPTPWLVHTVRAREDTGSLALVNGDVLGEMTLAIGAYPQRYGNRTGAWLDSVIREGSRLRAGLRGAVSASNASAVAEGPIGSTGRGSWLVSIRQSYLDWLIERVADDPRGTFGFTDTQAKIAWDVSASQQAAVTLVAGRSRFNQTDDEFGPNTLDEADARTGVAVLAWRSTMAPAAVLTQRLAVLGTDYDNRGRYAQQLEAGSAAAVVYRAEIGWTLPRVGALDAGIDVSRTSESQRTIRYFGPVVPGRPLVARSRDRVDGDSSRQAGFASLTWRHRRGVWLQPGLRIGRSSLIRETTASPWLLGGLPLTRSTGVSAGIAIAHQAPEVDAVLGEAGNGSLTSEHARHLDVSVVRRLPRGATLRVAAYDREERDMVRLRGREAGALPVPGAIWQNSLDGSARGVEIVLDRRAATGLSGWIGYSVGRTRYTDRFTGERFDGDFDQRHGLAAYGQYRWSGRTQLGARFRYGSNFPIPGYLEERPDGQFYRGTRLNAARLPPYARLDLRASRTFTFTTRRLTLFVETLNALGRKNRGTADGSIRASGLAEGYTEELFPRVPSAGILVEF